MLIQRSTFFSELQINILKIFVVGQIELKGKCYCSSSVRNSVSQPSLISFFLHTTSLSICSENKSIALIIFKLYFQTSNYSNMINYFVLCASKNIICPRTTSGKIQSNLFLCANTEAYIFHNSMFDKNLIDLLPIQR